MTKYEKGFKAGYAKSQAEYKRKQWIKANLQLSDETALLDAQMLQGSREMSLCGFKMPFPFSLFWS
ncbi:TPA: hypothetical protein NQG77_000231 [Salmonella enterica subsp. enterica serovar Infantis]|nr:hypothetical protein [Salmonella enterica subsp. enterica serovar Infantis]